MEESVCGYIMGNVNMGRSMDEISDIMYQCLPYAGYSGVLNALAERGSMVNMMSKNQK